MMFYVHSLVRLNTILSFKIKSIFLFIHLGNKCDINQREVPTHIAEQFAEKNDMWYLETSAKNSENVGKLFQTIAEDLTMKAKESTLSASNNAHDIFLNGNQTKPVNSNCC
jgi:Ras-related protein Rab-30